MRFMVIVKATASSETGRLPSPEELAAMGAFNEQLVQAGVMQAGDGLRPSREGRRVTFSGDQRTVQEGPFEPANELVAGFWLWQLPSIDDAVAWVKRCPNPMPEDSVIEIRPLYEASDFGEPVATQEAALREVMTRSR